MKKYNVFVEFKDGQFLRFDTDTDVRKKEPTEINGAHMVFTENQYAYNVDHVKDVHVTEN